jgi:hypothetical protein
MDRLYFFGQTYAPANFDPTPPRHLRPAAFLSNGSTDSCWADPKPAAPAGILRLRRLLGPAAFVIVLGITCLYHATFAPEPRVDSRDMGENDLAHPHRTESSPTGF